MTDISLEKQRLLNIYAQKYCQLGDASKCEKRSCTCSIAAELRAFVNTTIPTGYRDFTIRDFSGNVTKEYCLDVESAQEAKAKIFNYCWSDQSLLGRLSISTDRELDKVSIIDRRIKSGENIVIHGGSPRQIRAAEHGEPVTVTELPLGRTFVASILTKEAIKLKLDPRYRMFHYEWAQFNSLVPLLKKNDEETAHYEGCEWLVIDDITELMFQASGHSLAFSLPMLDSFFENRLKRNLITVLVFKFDINARRADMEKSFGVSINKIINRKNTTVVRLVGPKEEKSNDR